MPIMARNYSRGCVVYVDESGSFANTPGSFSGLGAMICPTDLIAKMRTSVNTVSGKTDPSEHLKGTPKGSKLRFERFEEIARILRDCGLLLCVDTIIETGRGNDPFRSRYASSIIAKSRLIGREDLGLKYAKIIQEASENDLFYAECVTSLFANNVVQVLASGPFPNNTEVVFHPKLASMHKSILELSVYMAFTTQLQTHLAKPIAGTFGLHDSPWVVRDPTANDREGLFLVDWALYPIVGTHRLSGKSVDAAQAAKHKECHRITKHLESLGLVNYSRRIHVR
jgi:hypothetical protein